MNAPDKIYLHGYDFDKEPCVKWHEKPMEKGMRGYHVVNVEYIRKDKLLEIVEAEKTRHAERDSIEGISACNALRELTDKLNSL